jgi:hypothetical protein
MACLVSTLPRAATSAFTALLTLTGSPKSSMTDPAKRLAFKKPIEVDRRATVSMTARVPVRLGGSEVTSVDSSC